MESNLVLDQSNLIFLWKWQEPKALEIQWISPKFGPSVPFGIKKLYKSRTYLIECVRQFDKLYCILVMGQCIVTLSL
jgi:hypothetical protein